MGRKPDQDVARSEVWRIRATAEESAELDRQCEAAGLDRSRYIRGLVGRAGRLASLGSGGPVGPSATGANVTEGTINATKIVLGTVGGAYGGTYGAAPAMMINREAGSLVIGGSAGTPDFDGETYDRERDHTRHSSALARVKEILSDGEWHSIAEVADRANISPAATSARFRDLRKEKFGGHAVERKNLGGGFWQYRLVLGE